MQTAIVNNGGFLVAPRAVETLAGWFSSAECYIRTIGQDVSPTMGHFGFFNRIHAQTLWREVEDWLGADR